jgi:hypothetical protein
MIDRFTNSAGDELLRRATSLEIKLYRLSTGGVEAHFEISGSIGDECDEEDSFGDTIAQPNDIRFVGELLRNFSRQGGAP